MAICTFDFPFDTRHRNFGEVGTCLEQNNVAVGLRNSARPAPNATACYRPSNCGLCTACQSPTPVPPVSASLSLLDIWSI